MKNKRAMLILTAILTAGTITPITAYGAGNNAARECRHLQSCQECRAGECPVCDNNACSDCGGQTRQGVCTDCGAEQQHLCGEEKSSGCRGNGNGNGRGRGSHHGRESRGKHCRREV